MFGENRHIPLWVTDYKLIPEKYFVCDNDINSTVSYESIKSIVSQRITEKLEATMLDAYCFSSKMYDSQTEEEKVVKLLKGGFEEKCGITFTKFIEIYHNILENNPEKLI